MRVANAGGSGDDGDDNSEAGGSSGSAGRMPVMVGRNFVRAFITTGGVEVRLGSASGNFAKASALISSHGFSLHETHQGTQQR